MYTLAVHFSLASTSASFLLDQLQEAWIQGVEGAFQLVHLGGKKRVLYVQRSADADSADYIVTRLTANPDLTVSAAVQQQLADEIAEITGDSSEVLPILKALRAGKGHIIGNMLAFDDAPHLTMVRYVVPIDDFMNTRFTNEMQNAAQAEGWGLFYTAGSSGGPVQIQKDDELDLLPNDEDGWVLVANGDKPHHKAALEVLRFCNEAEFIRVLSLRDKPTKKARRKGSKKP